MTGSSRDSDKRSAYQTALAEAEARLGDGEAELDLLFERARLLTLLGRDDEATQAYFDLLRRAPTHFGALTNLASIALATGHRSAALTAYRQAATEHPQNAAGLVNLANLLAEDGEFVEARALYERALALVPDHPQAYQGLGRISFARGELDAAQIHWRKGYAGQNAVTVRPYRGDAQALNILILASPRDGNVPLSLLLDDRLFAVTTLYAEHYDPAAPLPPHDAIFNAIGDADLCADALHAAARLVSRSAAPTINRPDAVLLTGREENARRFAHVPGVIAPHIETRTRDALVQENAAAELLSAGFEFPLLLRSPGYQTGQNFVRVDAAASLASAAATLPDGDVLAIELLDAAGADGMIRKYRVMMIDGRFYPLHMAASHDWKVHYFTSAMGAREELRREEEGFLCDMPAVLGPVAMQALHAIHDALGLEYAGIDFALTPDGRLLFFEANATMIVFPPNENPMWDYRRPAIARALDAAKKLLTSRAARD